MDGIINVMKPRGMTSFDVISYLRGVLGIKRIGHTGTLDPEVDGVLPVCVGKATKVAEYLTAKDKVYRATIAFGVTTDTQDATGKVLERRVVEATEEQIRSAIMSFVGKIQQMPPMYSAVKIDGKKLYEHARQGRVIERPTREIEVFSINVISVSGEKAVFDVHCSKGKYIRTLCADMGEKLGFGAHMEALTRLKSGEFTIEDAITLGDIAVLAAEDRLGEKLLRIDAVFKEYRCIKIDDIDKKRIFNGVKIRALEEKVRVGDMVRIYDSDDMFLGIGQAVLEDEHIFIRSRKMFC